MLFTICKAQLHVSATNVGHLRLHSENLSVIHACVGVYRVQGGGVSARSRKCGEVWGLGFGLVRNHM
jgi:hypothetical protein